MSYGSRDPRLPMSFLHHTQIHRKQTMHPIHSYNSQKYFLLRMRINAAAVTGSTSLSASAIGFGQFHAGAA